MRQFFAVLALLIIICISSTAKPYRIDKIEYYSTDAQVVNYAYINQYLAIDLTNKRYQIIEDIGNADMITPFLISQGHIKYLKDSIELIDKNNNLKNIITIKNDRIVFHQGLDFLKEFEFKKLDNPSGLWSDVENLIKWEEKYDPPKFKMDKNNKIIQGKYYENSSESWNKKLYYGISLWFENNTFELSYNSGLVSNRYYLLFSGTWCMNKGELVLKSNDGLNSLKFNIIDSETLVPQVRMPFSNEIKPLKLLKK